MRIAKTNTILKRRINKIFAVDHIMTLNRYGKGTKVQTLNITDIKLLIRFNKTREIFPGVTRV